MAVPLPRTEQPVNLLGLTRGRLAEWLGAQGEKSFRATQLVKWIHQFGLDDFERMTNLPLALRRRLAAEAVIAAPAIASEQRSADGTVKWLMRLADGNCVETVFIPEAGRNTLCISSQVGCALDCTFCATARQGFNRNLTAGEIVGQVWRANHALGVVHRSDRAITNVVFMGMGEPLANFDHVVAALELLTDDNAYGLSKRRVTVSTSGLVPALDRLRGAADVALAVSLHAPDDALRNELVPINRKYPIAELLAACRRYVDAQHHKARITFEYVMLDGINDSPQQARALARLLAPLPAKVNLIPFNPFPGTGYRCSPPAAVDRFRAVLQQHGLVTVTRRTRGDDIAAACGQLAGRVRDRRRRREARS